MEFNDRVDFRFFPPTILFVPGFAVLPLENNYMFVFNGAVLFRFIKLRFKSIIFDYSLFSEESKLVQFGELF